MTKILHISDPHAQSEAMDRLHNLAIESSCEVVVALTGDSVSNEADSIPQTWDMWPQKLKLSVPGNHDHEGTFNSLHSWIHRAPWVHRLDDLVFVGLSTQDGEIDIEAIASAQAIDQEGTAAVVLLSHYRADHSNNPSYFPSIQRFVGDRALLLLHGHEHPKDFPGSLWEECHRENGRSYFRSHVCSSVSGQRGLGHRIEWREGAFSCSKVQGPMTGGDRKKPKVLSEEEIEAL